MEEIYAEAQALLSWVDGRGPDGAPPGAPPRMVDLFAATSATEAALLALRRAKVTMSGVAPGLDALVVGLHDLPAGHADVLPSATLRGTPIAFRRMRVPRVRRPRPTGPPAAAPVGPTPVPCGSSISTAIEFAAGTLGCLVEIGGELHGLTNAHVTGGCHHMPCGMPIVSPGLCDVGPAEPEPRTIGRHSTCAPWRSGTVENTRIDGNLDVAVFKASAASVSSLQGDHFDTPTTLATGVLDRSSRDLPLLKVGRSTGLTRGRLLAHSKAAIRLPYEVEEFRSVVCFQDFYTVVPEGDEPFAEEGDSGSLVVRLKEGRHQAVGILFSASADDEFALVLPIAKVLRAMGATLVDGHNVPRPAPRGRHMIMG